MGHNLSKSKYVLLYGLKGSGKTLMQYSMQSSLKNFDQIKPTEGYNYEEVSIENLNLGIFDVSGDPQQYEVVNIITKCISFSGIIFMVPLDNLENLDKSRDLLRLVMGNNYIREGIALLIIYNYRSDIKEKLNWMTEELLDSRMNLTKLKEKFRLDYVQSCMIDVSNLDKGNFTEVFEMFSRNLEKESK